MTPIRQYKDDRLCGHCCVAMAAGVKLHEAIAAIGHRRGTSGKELVAALVKLGVRCFYNRFDKVTPARCIARIKAKSVPGWSGHWVLIWDGEVIDPGHHPGVFTPCYPKDAEYVGFINFV